MTGLVKAKNYDWKDSNLALFGTDTDRNVKKESAETEPAWKGAGQKVGLQIWRIVKFKVEHWPREDYGKFYNGDSYIILNTYKDKESDELLYDVHFWIGQNSTQDEYGTAAYKTVELDTLLDDKPIQHREVQGHESKTFKKYFPRLEHWKGGADTGFNHVEPEKYEPRLLHVRKEGRKVTIKEVTLCQKNLKKEDAYVIDCGMKIFQWNGVNAHMKEKYEAGQYTIQLRSARGGKPTLDVLDDQEDGQIAESVAETGVFDNGVEPDDDPAPEDDKSCESALIKLSDASGKLEFEEIASGSLRGKRQQLKSKDVFMVYTGTHLFVWIGRGCSKSEKQNSMSYAHDYLQKVGNPLLSVTALSEGQKNEDFDDVWR